MKITRHEWERLPAAYKSESNGQKRILIYDNGTCLVDVEIDDVDGVEMGVYGFTEHGLRFTLHAYTEQDALRVIRNCGHDPRFVNDIERLRSL